MYVVNDTVYINKVPEPSKTKIIINESNILYGSSSIVDVNPDTTNKLIVHSTVLPDIVKTDKKLIERFGEHKKEVDAVKRVKETVTTTTESTSSEDSSSETSSTTTKEVTNEVPCTKPEEVRSFAECELE